MTEFVRFGEIRRSVETALFDQPGGVITHPGLFRGLNKTLVRTGVGIYEVVTCPFPPYADPVFTDYLSPNPVYPDNYEPDLIADPLFATDNDMASAAVT